MTLHRLAAGLALATVAVLGLADAVIAGDQVPFRGDLDGLATSTGTPPTISVVVNATGSAAQLGQFTFTMPHTVNTATMTGSGTFAFVAASGDTVFGTETGIAALTGTPNVLFIVENATITGGTGRFAGATGGFTIERLYNRVSGVTTGSFEGTISSPGASH